MPMSVRSAAALPQQLAQQMHGNSCCLVCKVRPAQHWDTWAGLTLQAVAGLGLLAHHVEHAVYELSTLCVVPLGPVVARPCLPKDEAAARIPGHAEPVAAMHVCSQSGCPYLSGLKICPYGPDRTLSMVPGSCRQARWLEQWLRSAKGTAGCSWLSRLRGEELYSKTSSMGAHQVHQHCPWHIPSCGVA